jgi:hypothetical protein
MFESYINPYLVKFCSKVSVDELCKLIIEGKDVYQTWVEEFSDGDKPKIPEFACLLRDTIKNEVKVALAQVSPGHARVFEANPDWTGRQLDGLLDALFNSRKEMK